MTRYKNAMQENARIGSGSILALCCVSTNTTAKTTQHNTLFSVIIIVNRPLGILMSITYI